MPDSNVEDILNNWPKESADAAKLVEERYGGADEVCESFMVWHSRKPWKRVVAYKDYDEHHFPAPHIDCIESYVEQDVPTDVVEALAEFDGSVVVNRTRGELSARCHDIEANFLALNLANDIIKRNKNVEQARLYYAKEFLNYRKGEPTPYMEGLLFEPKGNPNKDKAIITDKQLKQATQG